MPRGKPGFVAGTGLSQPKQVAHKAWVTTAYREAPTIAWVCLISGRSQPNRSNLEAQLYTTAIMRGILQNAGPAANSDTVQSHTTHTAAPVGVTGVAITSADTLFAAVQRVALQSFSETRVSAQSNVASPSTNVIVTVDTARGVVTAITPEGNRSTGDVAQLRSPNSVDVRVVVDARANGAFISVPTSTPGLDANSAALVASLGGKNITSTMGASNAASQQSAQNLLAGVAAKVNSLTHNNARLGNVSAPNVAVYLNASGAVVGVAARVAYNGRTLVIQKGVPSSIVADASTLVASPHGTLQGVRFINASIETQRAFTEAGIASAIREQFAHINKRLTKHNRYSRDRVAKVRGRRASDAR